MSKSKIQNPKSKAAKNKVVLHSRYEKLSVPFCNLLFNMDNYFVICALLFVILTSGCAGVKETAKGIIGVSTKELEKNRDGAIKEVFNCEYKACYNETMGIIKETGAYIYAVDVPKNMVAVYVSRTDTTPAGLFFKKIGAAKTQIEVSSPSTYGKELIAKNIFTRLRKICPLEREKPKG